MTHAVEVPKLVGMDYRVVKPLGNGAGSTILLIADKAKSGRRYALKVVKRHGPEDDIYVDQAQVEFEVAQKLNHPAIERIYDCRVKKSWFRVTGVELLLEYIDGKTLDELDGPEMGQLVLIFRKVAGALEHMHRRGVYHGDLKPSNVMLSRGGQVKVIDFGTAWIRGQAKDRIQGTPQYMAPEQVTDRVVDDRTDVYNFGAMMYRMLTGQYANAEIAGVGLVAHVKPSTPISIDPEIPGTLNETIMACLHRSRDRRPAGLHEIKHQLNAVAKYMGLGPDDLRGAEEE